MKLHLFGSLLPVELANSLASLFCRPRVPQRFFVNTLWATKKEKPEGFPVLKSMAVTCATAPICACQVCVGSDKLALLHSTPTPQSTAIIFPYTISRSLPHLSLSASSECCWRTAWTDQHLSVTHVSTTKIAHGLTCHFNLQHLYCLGPKSGSNQWGRMGMCENPLASSKDTNSEYRQRDF